MILTNVSQGYENITLILLQWVEGNEHIFGDLMDKWNMF